MKIKTFSILVCIILIFSTTAFSKVLDDDRWEKTFGGEQYDHGFTVQQTNDGGYIVVGETYSYGAGKRDVWLVKIDEYGNKEWDKTFGGGDEDGALSIEQTEDGGYIITGSRDVVVIQGVSITGNLWLIKTDEDGNKEWDKTFIRGEWDYGSAVHQTSDGGYIIVGSSYGTENSVIWLIKTDDQGNKIWDKTFGGHRYDNGFDVKITDDNGYIITGIQMQTNGRYDADMWLIKTDESGDMEWERTFGGLDEDWAYCVEQTLDGGYIIIGDTRSFSNDGYDEAWLVKTDKTGNEEWSKTFGRDDSGLGYWGEQTSDGGYVIVGTYGPHYAFFDSNLWLIKTDGNGEKQWDKSYGRRNSVDKGSCVQQTSDGGYIITGLKGASDPLNKGGDGDLWLIKTDSNGNAGKRSRILIEQFLTKIYERFPILVKIIQNLT